MISDQDGPKLRHAELADSSGIRVDRAGGIVTVTLDRPDRKNAIIPAMWDQLTDAFREVTQREEDRVLVLTGAGGDFCSGADVRVKLGPKHGEMSHPELMEAVKRCVLALHELPVPTIAAVDGVAVGGGSNLAFACDFVVATRRARFSQIFVQRGLAVDTGGSWLLPRLVGLAVAKRMILTGEMLDASRAFELGLVSHVVEPEALDAEVAVLSDQLLALPAWTMAASKRLLLDAVGSTLAEALGAEAATQVEMGQHPKLLDLMRRFVRGRLASAPSSSDEQ